MDTVAPALLLAALIALLIKVRRANKAWAVRATAYLQSYSAAASRMSLEQMIADIALRQMEPLRATKRPPRLASFNGIGTQLYGHSSEDSDTGTYATTQWVTVVWLPLLPLARYRVVLLGDSHAIFASETRWRVIGQLPVRAQDWLLAALGWGILLVAILSSRQTW